MARWRRPFSEIVKQRASMNGFYEKARQLTDEPNLKGLSPVIQRPPITGYDGRRLRTVSRRLI